MAVPITTPPPDRLPIRAALASAATLACFALVGCSQAALLREAAAAPAAHVELVAPPSAGRRARVSVVPTPSAGWSG